MISPNEPFWPQYEALLSRILHPLGHSDGCSEEELDAAEERLGYKLPGLLREFYLRTGRREDINAAHDRLICPEYLHTRDGRLIFYEENQAVVWWAISMADRVAHDPPVDVSPKHEIGEWEQQYTHLSQFLGDMLLWQAVNGGMQYVGIGVASPDALRSPLEGWDRIETGDVVGASALIQDSRLLVVQSDDPNDLAPDVHAGASTERDFLEMTAIFAASWDYCTLDDEV